MKIRVYQKESGEEQAQTIQPVRKVRTPHAQPDLRGQWQVPLLTSLTFGVLAGLLGAVFGNEGDKFDVFVKYCLVVTTIILPVMLAQAWGTLTEVVELLLQRDLNRDGHIPSWPNIILNNRASVPSSISGNAENKGPAIGIGSKKLPVAEGETIMHWFVRHANKAGTAFTAFQGLLPRDQYNDYRDKLIGSGWADWNSYNASNGEPNTTQGWSLIAALDEILGAVYEMGDD